MVKPRFHYTSAMQNWVLLAYRLPREPSTPRIALWRRLRRLGAAQLGDGLVALPADDHTREQLEWLAGEVEESGGEATVWLAQPATAAQGRALADRMRRATAADYRAVAEAADAGDADQRRRNRLRRALRAIRSRDYFSADGRIEAERAVEALTAERVRV
jgi:ChrB-like protein